MSFEGQGWFQWSKGHFRSRRSFEGQWSFQGQRVNSDQWRSFQCQRVNSDQWRSFQGQQVNEGHLKVKGHFKIKVLLQINEGHLNVKGTQFHVVDRRAAVFFWQRCVWHQHQQQLQQLKRPLCSVRDAEHWIRLACTECYKLMNPPPTKEYNVAWSRIFNSIATSEQQPDMHHLTFHVTNSIWGERGFIPVPWLIHMSLQLCAIEKKTVYPSSPNVIWTVTLRYCSVVGTQSRLGGSWGEGKDGWCPKAYRGKWGKDGWYRK